VADHRYKASLRVFSQTLTVAELTGALGEPTESHDRGDPVSKHRPGEAKYRNAMWRLGSALEETAPLDQHISALLDYTDTNREGFVAISEQCEIDIFCGIFSGRDQGGFTFEPELSRRLAEADLAVGFDIYSDS
jgi:hypothetical protein